MLQSIGNVGPGIPARKAVHFYTVPSISRSRNPVAAGSPHAAVGIVPMVSIQGKKGRYMAKVAVQ